MDLSVDQLIENHAPSLAFQFQKTIWNQSSQSDRREQDERAFAGGIVDVHRESFELDNKINKMKISRRVRRRDQIGFIDCVQLRFSLPHIINDSLQIPFGVCALLNNRLDEFTICIYYYTYRDDGDGGGGGGDKRTKNVSKWYLPFVASNFSFAFNYAPTCAVDTDTRAPPLTQKWKILIRHFLRTHFFLRYFHHVRWHVVRG